MKLYWSVFERVL